MRKEMYTLKIDGNVVWTSDHLPYMKNVIAAKQFELCGAFHAEIYRYNKLYAFRFYNTKWNR